MCSLSKKPSIATASARCFGVGQPVPVSKWIPRWIGLDTEGGRGHAADLFWSTEYGWFSKPKFHGNQVTSHKNLGLNMCWLDEIARSRTDEIEVRG